MVAYTCKLPVFTMKWFMNRTVNSIHLNETFYNLLVLNKKIIVSLTSCLNILVLYSSINVILFLMCINYCKKLSTKKYFQDTWPLKDTK